MGELLTDPTTVGWYGIIGSGILLLIATWRLTAHMFGWCPGLINSSSTRQMAEGMSF